MTKSVFKVAILTLFFLQITCFFAQKKDRLPCIDKEFSVAIHIFKDTLGDTNITETNIQNSFIKLNEYFKPICVSFKVCEFIYHSNFQYDNLYSKYEWQEVQALYNLKQRINVYYVNKITEPNGVCGFAGLNDIGNVTSSGVVIQKSGTCCATPFKTIIHEFGHYFGLEHTFETSHGYELVDGSNCKTAGDGICDTPADPFVKDDPLTDYVNPANMCEFTCMKKDANNQFYSAKTGNVMSYYGDECMCEFTYEQYVKMANTYLNAKGMW